ncbi:MAG: PocR ligand-binding domain-containing protein [Desulfovibrionaceae bacterium]|jgi:ligand-binding sensor protein|nr:PocR ligand-binding domain-containing protein [Desulfovibrionaceae bacterium]
MKMTDLLPIATWRALEQEIHESYGFNAAATDAEGFRLSDWENWANEICPMVKSVPEATMAICSVVNQTFLAELRATGKPVIDECDAGLCKVSVPVLHAAELVGTVGGCGLMLEDGEVEEFLVTKTTGRSEAEVAEAATRVRRISRERAENFASWLAERIAALRAEHRG